MRARSVSWLGFLLFSAFCVFVVIIDAGKYELDLLTQSERLLENAGLREATITFDGRDAQLRGTASTIDIKEKADSLIRTVEGVRTIENLLVVLPPKKKENLQEKLNRLLANQAIEFQVNDSMITEEGAELLKTIAGMIKSHPFAQIEIIGHTDNEGTEIYNRTLSWKRAETVLSILVNHGIPSSSLHSIGLGSSRPETDNTTTQGRRRNRRVEFLVKEENKP